MLIYVFEGVEMEQLTFLITLSLLLVHEMDAIQAKEWKMFIVLKDMADEMACKVFIGIHFPLYFCAFYALLSGGTAEYVLKIIIDVFLLGHAVIHFAFRKHVDNGFRSLYSKAIIYSMAALALLHFILLFAI